MRLIYGRIWCCRGLLATSLACRRAGAGPPWQPDFFSGEPRDLLPVPVGGCPGTAAGSRCGRKGSAPAFGPCCP